MNFAKEISGNQDYGFNFTPYQMHSTILRQYDIRGIVGETLNTKDAFSLGIAFGTVIKRNSGSCVAVGYDGRHSSPEMADALCKGLSASGVNVENIGLCPTPMVYFAVKDRMNDGGIMVTGSHNPSEYNGFKMLTQSSPFFGDDILELGRMIAEGDVDIADENNRGTIKNIDIKETYLERLLRDFSHGRELKIAWDAGNGAVGAVLHDLVSKLPGEHVLLYADIDGDFPNHHPDPTVDENLVDLIKIVREQECDFGIAFDGDGDRIGIVDNKGNVIRGDVLMAIYARDVLEENPGAVIIGDVKCSNAMFDEIKRLGGVPIMWKTGHSPIKAKMAETKAKLAGELSGHIFFADKYYGFDDALYCAIRLMNAVSETKTTISEMISHLPKLYSTPEIRIEVDDRKKFSLINKIAENVKANLSEDQDLNEIDGVRVSSSEGWWLIRASNTQNVLVARIEAYSKGGMDRIKEILSSEIEKIGYKVRF